MGNMETFQAMVCAHEVQPIVILPVPSDNTIDIDTGAFSLDIDHHHGLDCSADSTDKPFGGLSGFGCPL